MNIYFVRHTTVNWDKPHPYFHKPAPLDAAGKAHAARIGAWLAQTTGALPIYTSPLLRTLQTAQIIQTQTGAPDPIADERIIEVRCPQLQETPDPTFTIENEEDAPTYEGHAQVLARVLAFYQDILMAQTDPVVVSHGTPLSLLYRHLAHIPIPTHMWSRKEDQSHNIAKGEILHVQATSQESATLARHIV